MKLAQGQIWKKETVWLRIVGWARLTIEYKEMPAADSKEGPQHTVSKKEFCRLIKGAVLVEPELGVEVGTALRTLES